MITISGYSDDIVCIGGDLEAEFSTREEQDGDIAGFLAFSDGTLLRYKYDGVWRITTVTTGEASLDKKECPEGDESNYSDVVTLNNGGIKWVAHCNDYVK